MRKTLATGVTIRMPCDVNPVPWGESVTVNAEMHAGQSNALAFPIDSNAIFPDFHLVLHPSQYLPRQLVIHHRLRLHLSFQKITV